MTVLIASTSAPQKGRSLQPPAARSSREAAGNPPAASATGRASATPRVTRPRSRPRASTPCSRSGRSSRRSRPPMSRRACCWTGKKRLRALAEGSSAGATATARPAHKRARTCPARLNRPETVDGWQVWDLALRLGGQLRVIPGAVIGWDMGAALALARALDIAPMAAGELLPEIEALMVRRTTEATPAPRR